jgi:D-alanine--poly(phosphoribitol) ligase subunit 1
MNILNQIQKNSAKYPNRNIYEKSTDILSGDTEGFLLWRELWDYSGKLAEYIKANTTSKEPIVVYGHKHPYMFVCFVACLRAGHAYCPIDISVPWNRVTDIINQVNPELILATEIFNEYLDITVTVEQMKLIFKTDSITPTDDSWIDKDETAYIIFTSGSTGVPKGVQITRDCIENFVVWAATLINFENYDMGIRFLNQAPFSFDLSVMDTYLAFYTGGTVVALDRTTQNNMADLMKIFSETEINVWVSTPSFAEICLADRTFNKQTLQKLNTMLFCGEVLTNKTARRLLKLFPGTEVLNTYGPTESTVAITDVRLNSDICDANESLPVGRPKAGTFIEIQNEEGEILKDGEKGEIVIIGDTVSTGYWKDEEKTRAAFGVKLINGHEYRTYRTGDAGYMKDGYLFCSGRIDLQIKLHGYRMELEDIEENILKLPYVTQVCVCPIERNGKITSLTAVLVPSGGDIIMEDFRERIRADLSKLLPQYMIPKKYITVNHLPLTNNGKLDRRAIRGMI